MPLAYDVIVGLALAPRLSREDGNHLRDFTAVYVVGDPADPFCAVFDCKEVFEAIHFGVTNVCDPYLA